MAKIPKSGIATAQAIQASHITNIVEALDGTGSYDIDATGSFSGSFDGVSSGSFSGSFEGSFSGDGTNITGVTAEWDGTHIGNAEITGSLDLTLDLIARNLEPRNDIFLNKGRTLYLDGQSVANVGIYSENPGGDLILYSGSTQIEIGYNNATSSPQVTITNANLYLAGAVTASSYTGSFVGDGSGLYGYTDNTFANANLTLDGDHTHTLGGNNLTIGGTGTIKLGPDNLVTTASFNHSGSFSITDSAAVDRLSVDTGETVFNDSGADMDFRIETDTNANMLFVEGSTDRVAIGKIAPNTVLDVDGDTTVTGSLRVRGGVTGSSYTGSFVGDGSGLTGVGGGTGDGFPFTGSAIISGSLEVSGSNTTSASSTGGQIIGRIRKTFVAIDNGDTITGSPESNGVYPGTFCMAETATSSANVIRFTLTSPSNAPDGAEYEFLLGRTAGGTTTFRIDTNAEQEMRVQCFGLDGTNTFSDACQTFQMGSGNLSYGDHITVTRGYNGGSENPIWYLRAFVSGGNGVSVS